MVAIIINYNVQKVLGTLHPSQSMQTCLKLSIRLDPYFQKVNRLPRKLALFLIDKTVINFAKTYRKYHSRNNPSKIGQTSYARQNVFISY